MATEEKQAVEEGQGTGELNGLDELDQRQRGRSRTRPPAPAHRKAPTAPQREKQGEAQGEKQAPAAASSAGREVATVPAAALPTPGYVPSQVSVNDGQGWEMGPGRPENLPSAAEVLNQRSPRRESLDASVAADLRLKKRLKRFALDNDVDHLPLGDIVTVALDDWLTSRGF
ncbi:hypothetical protein [Streptomyces sp. NPDC091383]|uniref:hypothetical protein n=1 Tax=Streptomyces sp. NPDC091383 TaxID=3365996 RepID=UPI00382C6E78